MNAIQAQARQEDHPPPPAEFSFPHSLDRAPAPWPRRRWWVLIGLIFGGQIGLIFLLSARSPLHPRPAGAAPAFHLAALTSSELLALNDPTLFALPNRQGFSGPAWLHTLPQKFPSFDWAAEPHWLPLPAQQLAQVFNRFMQTNTSGLSGAMAEADPELKLPEVFSPTVLRPQSAVKLEGSLVQRRLLKSLDLPAWPHSDILTNTVVRVVLDSAGRTISAVVLSGSGSEKADRHALEQANAARFEAITVSGPRTMSNPPAPLTWGEMIFEWHTLPAPPANVPR